MSGGDYAMPASLVSREDLDGLLMHAVEAMGASDINLSGDTPPVAYCHGRNSVIAPRRLGHEEVAGLVTLTYGGAHAITRLNQGEDLDYSYEDGAHRHRYRVNVTCCLGRNEASYYQMTLRPLPVRPVELGSLGVEEAILEHAFPEHGMVLVTGATGSGKSTLLAAILQHKLESSDAGLKILTCESPIEYVLKAPANFRSLVFQTEIPRHLPDFASGVRNAMRRNPTDIFIGEARDNETFSALIEASMTGHAAYSTVHANCVSVTGRRIMAGLKGQDVVNHVDLLDNLRLIVSQRLLLREGGGRVACREWLGFTQEIRRHLISLPEERVPSEIGGLVAEAGRPMSVSATRLYEAGEIGESVWRMVLAQYGGEAD